MQFVTYPVMLLDEGIEHSVWWWFNKVTEVEKRFNALPPV